MYKVSINVYNRNYTQKNMEKEEKERFTLKVGPLLLGLIKKQKQNVNNVCYGKLKISNIDAGEILAKKLIKARLV